MQKKVKYSHSCGVIKKRQGTAIPRHTKKISQLKHSTELNKVQELTNCGASIAEIFTALGLDVATIQKGGNYHAESK